MNIETAVEVWKAVAEWERDEFGGIARSSLTLPGGSATEYELHVPQIDHRTDPHVDEIDLLVLGDIVSGLGAGLYLHSTGGLVIR